MKVAAAHPAVHARAPQHAAPTKTQEHASHGDSDGWVAPKADALAAAWASNFKGRTEIPKSGDRGTVGGFTDPQLKVLHHLFWTAPPGADLPDIIALAKKDPSMKGAQITEDRLGLLTRYRPDSFPFSWNERKQSFVSFIAVEALTHTSSDVPAMGVLEGLRKQFPGFLSGVAISRLARHGWKAQPKLFPFVKGKLPTHGEGYSVTTTGEVKGLPRIGGKVALSPLLAHQIAAYKDDPRVRWDFSLEDLCQLISKDLGEPFTYQQWKHLGEKFPKMPGWFDIQAGARERFANLVRTVWTDKKLDSSDALMDVLHKEYGYKDVNVQTLIAIRDEFPKLIPRFHDAHVEKLSADAKELAAEAKKHPHETLTDVASKLGHDAQHLKALRRQSKAEDPDLLPLRRAASTPYTAQDRDALRQAEAAVPVGASMTDVYDELKASHPEVLEKHPVLADDFGRVITRELGIHDWYAHQRERTEALFASVAARADTGVSLMEIQAQMRDEHGAYIGYTALKHLVAAAEKNPHAHPEIAKLKKNGRYPWDIGFELTAALAKQVGAAIKAHADDGLQKIVGALMHDKEFAAKYPTFSQVHVQKLREKFPDLLPYVDDVATPIEKTKVKKWAGELDALATKAKHAAEKIGVEQRPSVAMLARTLGVKVGQVYQAVTRHPEQFPWLRRHANGNTDLQLAYRVADALEKAPIDETQEEITSALRKDETFRERYPSFGPRSIETLRQLYPDIIPSWYDRDQTLRSVMIADALKTAPKGTSFNAVVKKLEKDHPGHFTGGFASEEYVKGLWESDNARFSFATPLLHGAHLTGQGQPPEEMPASMAATRAARLAKVPDTLALVEAVASQVKDKPLDSGQRYEFVLVQHLLDSQIPTFDALKRLGMSPQRTSVIGIPYSASNLVVDALEDKGWNITVPPLDVKTWIEDVRAALRERLASALEHNRDVVVMDDGGIVSELVTDDPLLKEHADKFRIVEQTRRGITVADEVNVAAPVVNVAQSWAKFVEGPMIASSVDGKLVERLKKLGVTSLKGKHVGIVGAGTIGLPIAESLRALGATVTVLDTSDSALDTAKKRHFQTSTDRKKFFGGNDIIIGATGQRSITGDDLQYLKSGAILGSASSKLVEIDVDALAKDSKHGADPDVVDGYSYPPSVRYELGSKKVTLLARGFPLNFDGEAENIAPEQIQLTRALMVLGLLQATKQKVDGVRRLDPKLELNLLEEFKKLGGGRGDAAVKKVLEQAMHELKQAVAHPGTHYRRHES